MYLHCAASCDWTVDDWWCGAHGWDVLIKTLLSLVFGITLHGPLAPSLTGAQSPWSWVPARMKIEDKKRDTSQNNFISHIRDIMSKAPVDSLHQIPWVARLMPHPIPYQTTHTWRSYHERNHWRTHLEIDYCNMSYNGYFVAICHTRLWWWSYGGEK